MLDLVVKVLGVFGFVIASASLGWQIWTYRDARKEKVGIKLSMGMSIECPELSLYADVWNAGRIPVFIKGVELAWGDEQRCVGAQVTRLSFRAHPPLTRVLQVGQGQRFILMGFPADVLKGAVGQPEGKVWISVTTPRGEVLRLSGAELHTYVSQLASSKRGHENAASD